MIRCFLYFTFSIFNSAKRLEKCVQARLQCKLTKSVPSNRYNKNYISDSQLCSFHSSFTSPFIGIRDIFIDVVIKSLTNSLIIIIIKTNYTYSNDSFWRTLKGGGR